MSVPQEMARPSTPIRTGPSQTSPGSSPRPSHQLGRSISEISPPTYKHHHHYHRPHLHRHTNSKDDSSKPHGRDRTQPYLTPKTSESQGHSHFGHGFLEREKERFGIGSSSAVALVKGGVAKSDGNSPNGSRAGSRRPSLRSSEEPESMDKKKKVDRDGQVMEEKANSLIRVNELQKTLEDLTTHSNNTTSRLDNTYYSVLEKLSVLQTTLSSLQDLAMMTREVTTSFETDHSTLIHETDNQLGNMSKSAIDDPGAKIAALQQRISTGGQKVQVLGSRVEAVKMKVEKWERVESEWRVRTRKRLKILWILMSVTVGALLILVVIQYTPATFTPSGAVLRGLNDSNFTDFIPDTNKILSNESMNLTSTAGNLVGKMLGINQTSIVEDDPRLGVFDGLI